MNEKILLLLFITSQITFFSDAWFNWDAFDHEMAEMRNMRQEMFGSLRDMHHEVENAPFKVSTETQEDTLLVTLDVGDIDPKGFKVLHEDDEVLVEIPVKDGIFKLSIIAHRKYVEIRAIQEKQVMQRSETGSRGTVNFSHMAHQAAGSFDLTHVTADYVGKKLVIAVPKKTGKREIKVRTIEGCSACAEVAK